MSTARERAREKPTQSGRRRIWASAIGTIVGLVGMGFVVATIVEHREDVIEALEGGQPAFLVVAVACAGLGMTGIGLTWHACLMALGTELDVPSSLRGYFVGQLGKYIPGGIWAIMGRAEWVRGKGVSRTVAYTSVVLSMGTAYLAATLVAALLIPLTGSTGEQGDTRYRAVLLLLPLGFALLHPAALRRLLTMVRRLTGRDLALDVPSWGASSLLVLRQLPSWLLIGSANLAICAALGSAGDPVNVISATIVSWVIGFLALPTPGGIGVREAAFVALATSLPSGVAAAVALIARIVFIAVDATGAGVTTLAVRKKGLRARR